jgi:hypothetical protein
MTGFAEVVSKSESAGDFSIMSTFLEALHALSGESDDFCHPFTPIMMHFFKLWQRIVRSVDENV